MCARELFFSSFLCFFFHFVPIRITLFTFFLFVFYLCLHIFWPGYITFFIALFTLSLLWVYSCPHFFYLWLYSNMVSWIYLQHAVLFFLFCLFFLFLLSISYHNLFCFHHAFSDVFLLNFFGHTKIFLFSSQNCQHTYMPMNFIGGNNRQYIILHDFIQGSCSAFFKQRSLFFSLFRSSANTHSGNFKYFANNLNLARGFLAGSRSGIWKTLFTLIFRKWIAPFARS